MAAAGKRAQQLLVSFLRSEGGLRRELEQIGFREGLPEFSKGGVEIGEGSPLQGKDGGREVYPGVWVHCVRVKNLKREKFAKFSGTVELGIDVVVSGRSTAEVEAALHLYCEAVTNVLERIAGDWGEGLTYDGNYEVRYESVKPGGRMYVQAGRILVEVSGHVM